ncbi:MAG: hypothetical protein CVV03_03845 [Firmicutes bacterium HGW-Firmicutes-8]|nr:MAG: hypothetical protein CVV03_03845 [Firmicutes bacterium HGW-Firmicutes-8]
MGCRLVKNLPKFAQLYIILVSLLALILLIYFYSKINLSLQTLSALIFFCLLATVTNSLKVYLSKGGYVTVTFAVTYACVLLFGAPLTAYIEVIGMVLSNIIIKDKSPWYKLLFNCGQSVICVAAAQFAYSYGGGINGNVDTLNIVPLMMSAVSFFLVNSMAITIILALVQNMSPWEIWISNLRWTFPNMFTLSLLGILMAGIYSHAGYWGVSLFFIPLLLARFIFKSYMDVREVYLNTLEALASALDAKDKYTRGHSERVARYAVKLARELKLPEEQVEKIESTALLHDIGKIGVNAELLSRSGKLSVREYDIVKLHPVIGANIIKDIHDLGSVTDYVRHHHEKYDGSGYPDNLHGENIPLGARIITLADSFDAMTSGRSYRKEVTFEEAIKEVKRCAGTHFDPLLAEVFINCWQEKVPWIRPNSLVEVVSGADK